MGEVDYGYDTTPITDPLHKFPAGVTWHAPGIFYLGPSNGAAVGRLAHAATEILRTCEEIPDSPFAKWVAERLTAKDKQDLIIFLAGRRGSGKSYSSLYIAERVSKAIAKVTGKKPEDYFTLANCATLEDNEGVAKILDNTGDCQIIIIDDASLAVNNRNWASPANKNFVALITVCRDRRWLLMFTAPLKKMTDNQVRDMVDITMTVYKPFHSDVNGKGGFNLIKAVSGDISTSGKEYARRLHFSDKKIDFWVTFRPDPDMVKQYDVLRSQGSKKVSARIAGNGPEKPKPKGKAEQNLERMLEENKDRIADIVRGDPGISTTQLGAQIGQSYINTAKMCSKLGIQLHVNRKRTG